MKKYAKDFKFFLEHQIALSTTNNGKYSKFYSRLNGELFKTIDNNKALSNGDIISHCKTIHKGLEYYN